MCRWSAISSPADPRAFVQASIASARAGLTCVVVQTRGFHMIVIGTRSPSAIAAVFASSASPDASPSKSSESTKSRVASDASVPSRSRTRISIR
ncbi:MAG: hypothetical protein E6I20_06730 [Chloroflexi bacterium]|nr:MAG: hypothetical protein E6I20_06730 [Chloroflexota bacterium]